MRAVSCAVCAFTLLTFCKPAFGSVITSAKDLAAAQAALARSASSSGDGKITICVVPGETSDSVANTTKPRRCRNYTRDADGKMVAAGDFYEKPPVLEAYEPSIWTATSHLATRLMDYVGSFVAGKPRDGSDRAIDDQTVADIDALVLSVDATRAEAIGRARREPTSGDLRRSVTTMADVANSFEQAGSDALTGAFGSVMQQSAMASSMSAAPNVAGGYDRPAVAATGQTSPSQTVASPPARQSPATPVRRCTGIGWSCAAQ